MILFLSICLLAVTAGTIIQTNELHRTRKALEASDSVVLKAEEYLMRERVEQEIAKNSVLTGVLSKFYGQTEKGLQKYGNTVNPDEYTEEEWLLHFQQEMIDGAVYVETLLQKRSTD